MSFRKVLSHFRRNLPIRHLVNCLNTYDASTEVASLQTGFQFLLCLTWTKYENGFRIPKTRNYRIVVDIEMSRKRPLAAIVCRYLQWLIGTLQR
jgi:hypothetical protein